MSTGQMMRKRDWRMHQTFRWTTSKRLGPLTCDRRDWIRLATTWRGAKRCKRPATNIRSCQSNRKTKGSTVTSTSNTRRSIRVCISDRRTTRATFISCRTSGHTRSPFGSSSSAPAASSWPLEVKTASSRSGRFTPTKKSNMTRTSVSCRESMWNRRCRTTRSSRRTARPIRSLTISCPS